MKLLICSIMRDTSAHFKNYVNVLSNVAVEHDIYLSIFENDSVDATSILTAEMLFEKVDTLAGAVVDHQTLGHPKFGSVSSEQRVTNLAHYRNQSIENGLKEFEDVDFDYLIFWDIDAEIDPITAVEFLAEIDRKRYSCISPVSIERAENRIYDLWALRETPEDRQWPRHKLLGPGVHQVWSTFNCFCAYDFKAIREGARFSSFNRRLGTWDCDTVVICEDLHHRGYDNIAVDARFKVNTR